MKGSTNLRIPDWALPFFAPLPRTMIEHIYANRLADDRKTSSVKVLEKLLLDFKVARRSAFVAFNPAVILGKQRDGYSVQWYLQLLSKHSPNKHVPRTTLTDWYQRNLIHYRAYGDLDPDSAAAVLIARLLDRNRKKLWLPEGSVEAVEPRRYCWWQASPKEDLVVTGVPIAPSLPKTGILISLWRGWDREWIRYGRGSIRWRMIDETPARGLYWDVTPEELINWDKMAHSELEDFPSPSEDLEMRESMIEGTACMVLHRLAARYFRTMIPAMEKEGLTHERERAWRLLV